MDLNRRWADAVHFDHNSFKNFWSERLIRKRDLLIITGLGWDPRMSALPSLLKDFGGEGLRQVHLIQYSPSPNFISPHQEFIEENTKAFEIAVNGWAVIEKIQIYTRKEGNFYIGDEAIAKYYAPVDFSSFSDIMVDISALPKSLFFTLLFILVKKADTKYPGINLIGAYKKSKIWSKNA